MTMFQLTLVTPTSTVSHEIDWLEIQTQVGNRVIQVGHAPMVALLKSKTSVFFQRTGSDPEELVVADGVCRVERTVVTLIVTLR